MPLVFVEFRRLCAGMDLNARTRSFDACNDPKPAKPNAYKARQSGKPSAFRKSLAKKY
jgi:hypothetical protein